MLERFGSDVTVLRTGAPDPGGATLLMTCAGADRRFRLTLPAPAREGSGVSRAGSALIRAIGAPFSAGLSVATRFVLAGDGSVTASSAEPARSGDVVGTIGRMLLRRSRGFDLLYRLGPVPTAFGETVTVRLLLASEPGDAAAFSDFAGACAGDAGRSGHRE